MAIGSGLNWSQTPSMFLRLPVPGQCGPLGVEPPSFSWLELLNASLSTLDSHSHAPGYGIPVPAAGLNINAALGFNSNDATALRSVRFSPIGLASLGASDLSCLAVSGGDLYYVDAQANQVRLTAAGAMAGTPGSISGLAAPAAATYTAASKLFTFTSASGFAAGISAGPLSIGDATLANGKAVTIGVPAGLGASYSMTLPNALPAANALLALSTTGALSAFGTVSGSSLSLNDKLVMAAGSTAIQVTSPGSWLQLQGNLPAGDVSGNADITLTTTVTRTAGRLLRVTNNGVNELIVDYQGLLTLGSQAAPIQPAGLSTAVAPNAGWFAANGAGYWKDACGVVRLKGAFTRTTGGTTVFTLPAGFRPAADRLVSVAPLDAGNPGVMTVHATGDVSFNSTSTTATYYMDGISFLAEA